MWAAGAVAAAVAAARVPRPPPFRASTASIVRPQSGEVGSNELGRRPPLFVSSRSTHDRAAPDGAEGGGGEAAEAVEPVVVAMPVAAMPPRTAAVTARLVRRVRMLRP